MHKSWHSLRCAPLLLMALLAACGQKGPLYRTDPGPEQTSPGNSSTTERKKSGPKFPAPQSQKEDRDSAPSPSDPTPAAPANDSDRGTSPPLSN